MSNETKWTPGPWRYEPSDYPGLEATVVKKMGRIMGAGHGEYTICQMCDFGEPELYANARLIAAAPNLHKYATQVMEMLEEHGPDIVPHLMDSDDNPGQRLREELAKAKGETQ